MLPNLHARFALFDPVSCHCLIFFGRGVNLAVKGGENKFHLKSGNHQLPGEWHYDNAKKLLGCMYDHVHCFFMFIAAARSSKWTGVSRAALSFRLFFLIFLQ